MPIYNQDATNIRDEAIIETSQVDLFGRPRVGLPKSIFSKSHRSGLLPLDWDTELATGGSITHNADNSTADAVLTTASGAKVYRETFRNFSFNTGKAQYGEFGINWGEFQANVRKRAGLFDVKDGYFIEVSGMNAYVVRRTSTSGSVVDNKVERSNWDDPLDGTGPSGITFPENVNMVVRIEYPCVSGNRVKFSIVTELGTVTFHTLNEFDLHNNIINSHNLPMRYELENLAAVTSASTIHFGCQKVVREGFEDDQGLVLHSDSGTTYISATTTPLIPLAFQFQSGQERNEVAPISFTVVNATGNRPLYYSIYKNVTLTGATWSNGPTGSIMEFLTGYTSYSTTGARLVDSGYIPKDGNSTAEKAFNGEIFIGSDIAGNSENLCMILETYGTTGTTSCSINGTWREST